MDVKHDAFDAMWSFLQMGNQRPNIEALKENCELLRRMMMQKTAGQRANRPNDVSIAELDNICNIIVIETMCLYLSGTLGEIERRNKNGEVY